MFFLLPHFFLRFKPIPKNASGHILAERFLFTWNQYSVSSKKGPGEIPGTWYFHNCSAPLQVLFRIVIHYPLETQKTTATCRFSFLYLSHCPFAWEIRRSQICFHLRHPSLGFSRGPSGYSPVRFSRTPESIIPSAGFRLLSCNLLLARYVVSLMLLL